MPELFFTGFRYKNRDTKYLKKKRFNMKCMLNLFMKAYCFGSANHGSFINS